MKELKYITLAQVIGCLLVIWGHSYPFVTEVPVAVKDVKSFIYLFHMPLFIFCSGFLLAYTRQIERTGFAEYVGQRAKRLLHPYFALSLICILPKVVFSSVLNDSLHLDAMSILRAFLVPRENIWGHFWFLPMIFLMGCLAYLTEKYVLSKTDKRWGWGIVTVLLMVCAVLHQKTDALQWLGINDLLKYGWSYALGVEAYLLLGDMGERVTPNRVRGTALALVAGGVFLY